MREGGNVSISGFSHENLLQLWMILNCDIVEEI